jgi:general transcription factor 3C polypeptide 3 (transcription factor C subunit 4)
VIDSRKKRPKDTAVNANPADSQSSSLFEESTTKKKSKVSKTGRLTLPQLHELERKKEEEVKRGYKLLCELWPKMLLPQGADGQELAEREWLLEAEKLVDMFRETRNLFRTSRVSVLTPPRSPMSERNLSRVTRSEACYQRERSSQSELPKKTKTKWHRASTWTLVRVKVH